ncbi:formylglycine-generating enzyme family protein [Acinetobacter sp. I-MWF]|uniref:formylglycine-generating enzyme family protein n=1 Tax=Acinetobacter sp. I-MWF TaxID=2940517 RepID=UPI0021C6BCA1|nr:formylglycine-generating enzyme family protein [Acinetobacter sp. I-MWF]MCT9977769.1 formylglycine-generating enzyme family protein [Acinetobacter sp. I-MWF]
MKKGKVGWADLLEIISLTADENQHKRCADFLGFTFKNQVNFSVDFNVDTPIIDFDLERVKKNNITIEKLRAPIYGVLEHKKPNIVNNYKLSHKNESKNSVLLEKDCEPRCSSPENIILWKSMCNKGLLWPALKKIIEKDYYSDIDIDKLIKKIGLGECVTKFNYIKKKTVSKSVVIIIDRAKHLKPYQKDIMEAFEIIKRIVGYEVKWCFVDGTPNNILGSSSFNFSSYPSGANVLVFSDCGELIEKNYPHIKNEWKLYFYHLNIKNNIISLLSPQKYTSNKWQVNQHLIFDESIVRLKSVEYDLNKSLLVLGLKYLKVLASISVVMDFNLLRSLRLALPYSMSLPELEAIYLQDNEVATSISPIITPGVVAKLRRDFSKLDINIQRNILMILTKHHKILPQSIEMTEILLWEAHSFSEARGKEERALIVMAKEWFEKLKKDMHINKSDSNLNFFVNSTLSIIMKDDKFNILNKELLVLMWSLDNERLKKEILPKGIDESDVNYSENNIQLNFCWIIKNKNYLCLQSYSPDIKTSELLIVTLSPCRWVRFESENDTEVVNITSNKIKFDYNKKFEKLTLTTSAGEIVDIGNISPKWLGIETGQNNDETYAILPIFGEYVGRKLSLKNIEEWKFNIIFPKNNFSFHGMKLEAKHGIDTYGIYVDLYIENVIQRMRWITPGRFLMGALESPHNIEHLSHEVILTEGYWLADTACTQELWGLVMGYNPSKFNHNKNNPVESVTWIEVQGFLEKINNIFGFSNFFNLPSEAEWEYACRAMTNTNFSWGDDLNILNANYDGEKPFRSGEKGSFLRETRVVKYYQQNPWGLWQMHGNVWEWCLDTSYTPYKNVTIPRVDPISNNEKVTHRIIRGGGWNDRGENLTSFYRGYAPKENKESFIGFRLLFTCKQ